MTRRVYKHKTEDRTLVVEGDACCDFCDTNPLCFMAVIVCSAMAGFPLMIYGTSWINDAYGYHRLNQDLKGSEPAKCQITWLNNYYCDGNHIGIEAKGIADICIPHFGNMSIPWSGDVGPYDNCYKPQDVMLPYQDNGYTENMIVDCRADCQAGVWYTNKPYSNPYGLFLRGILCVLFPFFVYCILRFHKKCLPKCCECESNWIKVSGNHPRPREYLDRNQNPTSQWRNNDSNNNVKVGFEMKISGAQKYNGELVRVIEVLEDDKARVQFENSETIIRLPTRCLKKRSHEECLKKRSHKENYSKTEWQKAHLDLRQKIRGDWRNSDGLLISVEDDIVTFLPSTNSYPLYPFGQNRLKMKIGDAWWCYSNKSSEDILIWSNRGESVTWDRRVMPLSVDDLPPSYEHSSLQVEMSTPSTYEHTHSQVELSTPPPAYDEVGPSAPPAYQNV